MALNNALENAKRYIEGFKKLPKEKQTDKIKEGVKFAIEQIKKYNNPISAWIELGNSYIKRTRKTLKPALEEFRENLGLPKEMPVKSIEPWYDLSTTFKSENDYGYKGPDETRPEYIRAVDGKKITPFEKLNQSL